MSVENASDILQKQPYEEQSPNEEDHWTNVLEEPGDYGSREGYRVFKTKESTVVGTPQGVAKTISDGAPFVIEKLDSLRFRDLSAESKIKTYEELSGQEGKNYKFPQVLDTSTEPEHNFVAVLLEDMKGNKIKEYTGEERNDKVNQLGKALSELKDEGIYVRDLNPNNFRFQNNGKIAFVDLEYTAVGTQQIEY